MHDVTHPSGLRSLPMPVPAAGLEAYQRERALALASDARRKANYDAYQAHQRRGAVVDYLPIKLNIENVSRCNFRCTMCVVAEWPKGQRAEDMTFDDFRRLIDEQYGLVEIKLQGIGEPLMQRGDEFFEMIRYARSKHIWVRTTTNASQLHLRTITRNWSTPGSTKSRSRSMAPPRTCSRASASVRCSSASRPIAS